jgi:cathepsin A (carboxypeptidase C)
LPAGVFECASKTVVEERGEMVRSRGERIEERGGILGKIEDVVEGAAEDVAEVFGEKIVEKELKSQYFNLKEGITLTLTSDAVDKDFCDPNSDVSLAGYMNVKGSQFDTQNDKNLFFWMFEKRTTSLVNPDKNSPSLKSEWNWPCIFDCDEPQDTPSQDTDSSQSSQSDQESSTTNIAEDKIPLVIWLTGGPGCSSSLALLTENGPCSVNEDGETTAVNPHSWTESAHVLWLDQPADVGYSYGQSNDSNEEMISEDAYYFLQAFFQSDDGQKYKNNPLFIVGESYGGHYAPAIAHRIWRGNKDLQEGLLNLNLAGLAVGNGLTNPEIQYQYYSEMAFKNSHNLQVIDENTYNGMKAAEPLCTTGIHKCNGGDGMLNSFACQAAFLGCNTALTTPYRMTGLNPYDIRKPCGDNPLCYDFSHVEKFMNLASTKKALHVDSHNPNWQTCNMLINMSFHTDWMKDFSGYVADLLNDGIPALIYAGDVDFICNYLGNKAWTTALEWNHGAEFQAAEDHDWNNGAGLARTAGGLTFLQVYDAGHMVPSDQPEHALTMITQFMNGEAF